MTSGTFFVVPAFGGSRGQTHPNSGDLVGNPGLNFRDSVG